jgi:hypothetical protein
MTDKQFMQSKRRKIQKIFPNARISQYQKNYSFRVHCVGHGTNEQLMDLLNIGEGIKIHKLTTISPPHTPYIFIVF